MPIQSENPVPTAISGPSPNVLRLLPKRLRELLRGTLVLATCFAVAATAFAIRCQTNLNRLPDIGEPFDVVEIQAFSLPGDQNAFKILGHSNEKSVPLVRVRGPKPYELRFLPDLVAPESEA